MHKVLRPRSGVAALDLAELWQYRELLGFLAWRDVVLRYKQTTIGIFWAFIRPLITMVIFTIVFGRLAKLPSEQVPYSILTFTALLPWQFFATAFADSAATVVGNGHMISKVYFPRLILPLASIAVGAVDFAVSFGILLILMLVMQVAVSVKIVFLPFFLLVCALFTGGLGMWFAALFVKYRDVRHLIPFILQIGLYVSPVGFSTTVVPERWRLLYSLNPMVSVIDGFRWSVLGTTSLYIPGLILGTIVSIVVFVWGLYYFKGSERAFADLI